LVWDALQHELCSEELRHVWRGEEALPAGWTDAEADQLCLFVQCLEAAVGPGDLHSLRVLYARPVDGSPDMSRVQLSSRRPLTVTYKTGGDPLLAVVESSPESLEGHV